jgi:DNA-directed RNA polymerase subunit K
MTRKDLTRFEKARILGARAIQLSMGAEPQVEVNEALDPIDIAYQELEADVLPLDVFREVLTDEGSDDS